MIDILGFGYQFVEDKIIEGQQLPKTKITMKTQNNKSLTMKKVIVAVFAVTALAVPQVSRGEDTFKPEIGFRFVLSPGYNDALEDSYPDSDVSGGYGWFGLSAGLRFAVTEQLELIPRIGLLMNYVLSVGDDDSFANTIVQPALAGRFLFNEGSSFFVEGEVSYNSVNTGSDAFDVDGGIGYAALVGYQWERGLDLSVGYSVLSTEVTNYAGTSDENFGGVEVRFNYSF